MKTVILPAFAFLVVVAGTKLVLPLVLLAQGQRRPSTLDDFLMAGYIAVTASALGTLGFVIPAALSATWRRLAVRRAVLIAGGLGLTMPIVSIFVTVLIARAVLPLFRSAPWLAIGLLQGSPGVVLGLLAVAIALRSDALKAP